MSNSSDTRTGDKLPERPRTKRGKNTKQAQTPPPAFPNVFAENFGYVDTSEAGNTIIKILAQLQEAAESAEGRARWEAWQILQSEVQAARDGKVPMPIDLAEQPELFVAVQAVSAWIDAFAPVYLPEGQDVRTEANL